jgi:hypothetical protein
MHFEMPTIELSPENVAKNAHEIAAARVTLKAMLKALDGYENANLAICDHEGSIEVWKGANYGGYSPERYLRCPKCRHDRRA